MNDDIKPAVEVFDAKAELYETKFMNVDKYAPTLTLFCQKLKLNAQVLELACGVGNLTRFINDKRADLQFLATDLAPNMLKIAQKNNPNIHFQLLDFKQINQLKQRFDAVICGFGLPYLSKREALLFIKDLSILTNPNAWVYISTIEDKNEKSGVQYASTGDMATVVNYHEAEYLCDELLRYGFRIAHINRMEKDLEIIAEKIS